MNLKDVLLKSLQATFKCLKAKRRDQIIPEICHQNTNTCTMEPPRKKTKLVAEESEIIIDIDPKGACTFKVISKVESSVDENIDVHKNENSSKNMQKLKKDNGFSGTDKTSTKNNLQINGSKLPKTCQLSKKICRDKFPPTSSYVALDCEFVGVRNDQSALGRCSIVDYDGQVICDIYARPLDKITTYRTRYSGITKQDMAKSIPIESALSQIADIIKDKIVVGHALHNDFKVLGFSHPLERTRDTQKCGYLSQRMKKVGVNTKYSLKNYASTLLGKTIQKGGHCSIIDARVTMELYKLVRDEWEPHFVPPDNCNGNSDKQSSNKPKNNSENTKSDVTDMKQSSRDSVENWGNRDKTPYGIIKVSAALDYNKSKCVKAGDKRKLTESVGVNGVDEIDGQCDTNTSCDLKSGTGASYINNSLSGLCKLKRPSSKKKHKLGPVGIRKSALATEYTNNVKHLFHDLFWENEGIAH